MNINRFLTGLLSAALAAAVFAGFLTAQSSPRAAPASTRSYKASAALLHC